MKVGSQTRFMTLNNSHTRLSRDLGFVVCYILESDNETSEGHVLFVKNLNFDTNEDSLKEVS